MTGGAAAAGGDGSPYERQQRHTAQEGEARDESRGVGGVGGGDGGVVCAAAKLDI